MAAVSGPDAGNMEGVDSESEMESGLDSTAVVRLASRTEVACSLRGMLFEPNQAEICSALWWSPRRKLWWNDAEVEMLASLMDARA